VQDKRKAFETLVEPHFDALYRAAYRLTRIRSDAEDLVQEVCLRAFADVDRLQTLDYVLGWLLRVQYRVFVDSVRRRKHWWFGFGNAEAGNVDGLASDAPGPEEVADLTLRRRRLEAAWKVLTPSQRALLALHAEGYTLAELEQITGLSRNVISVRLHCARARLSAIVNRKSSVSGRIAPIGEAP